MATFRGFLLLGLCAIILLNAYEAHSAIPKYKLNRPDRGGPYTGLVIPEKHDLEQLYADPNIELGLDVVVISGRRFEFGRIGHRDIIVVVSGTGLINSGITTQLLLTHFNVDGVVHLGVAGAVDPSLRVGDVVIPKEWAHTALWTWQQFGQGKHDPLPLESTGRFTRKIGYLNFADYTTNVSRREVDNELNNVWFQNEEVFSADANGEETKQVFWVDAERFYVNVAKRLKGLNLVSCMGDICLPHTPKLNVVRRGSSSSFFLDNAAYRDFIHKEFKVSSADMESAGVALVCFQQKMPFIVIRGISNLVGSDSGPNENEISALAFQNAYISAVEFVKTMDLRGEPFIRMV